jgi:hypothetical protein
MDAWPGRVIGPPASAHGSRCDSELDAAVRPTPLDPSRPALDLLEDLLSGISACWLNFLEYASDPGPEMRQAPACPRSAAMTGSKMTGLW